MIRGKHWDDGWLTAYWGRDMRGAKKDLIFGSPCRPDGHLLYGAFSLVEVTPGKTLVKELEDRGYDITTLQFSIKRKWKPNEAPTPPICADNSKDESREGNHFRAIAEASGRGRDERNAPRLRRSRNRLYP